MVEEKPKTATLVNASGATTSITIWVQMSNEPQPAPIAWICALLSDGGFTKFKWTESYEYIWGKTGKLVAGKTVSAAQRLPVTKDTPAARIEKKGQTYRLHPYVPPNGLPPDTLRIEAGKDIPLDTLTIGVNSRIVSGFGQPGNGSNVVQAEPNVTRNWKTDEKYFASFGQVVQSEFDPQNLSSQKPLAIDFNSGPDIVLMLEQGNVLKQLRDSKFTAREL
ncbi:MAG: hypothetical protein ABJQ71_22240 [Roseibium sp.]